MCTCIVKIPWTFLVKFFHFAKNHTQILNIKRKDTQNLFRKSFTIGEKIGHFVLDPLPPDKNILI